MTGADADIRMVGMGTATGLPLVIAQPVTHIEMVTGRACRKDGAKMPDHAPGCDYHCDQYSWECSCAARHADLGRLMDACGVINDGRSPPVALFQQCLDAIAKLKS